MTLRNIYKIIEGAEAIAVFAGAGMGVDSGLEQYRGADGLWTKCILINYKEIPYKDLLCHESFDTMPEQSWAFIAYLIDKYKHTIPHKGFEILLDLVKGKEYFIVTSNCDEQFQKAGFDTDKIWECHGSIFNMQCMDILERNIYITPALEVDTERMILLSDVPKCPVCGLNCRPNMYLFYDWFWVSNNSVAQQIKYNKWHKETKACRKKIVVLEIGAGKTIDTVRKAARSFTGEDIPLIRVNPNDFETYSDNQIGIKMRAKEFFEGIVDYISIR